MPRRIQRRTRWRRRLRDTSKHSSGANRSGTWWIGNSVTERPDHGRVQCENRVASLARKRAELHGVQDRVDARGEVWPAAAGAEIDSDDARSPQRPDAAHQDLRLDALRVDFHEVDHR